MHLKSQQTLIFLITFSTLFLAACNGYEVTLNDRVVYNPFPNNESNDLLDDPNLQGCLNEALKSEENSEIGTIRLLTCPDSNISTLNGIQNLVNLEQLELSNNNILDLSPLANLNKLRVISLRNNKVRNIRPLFNLPILRFVTLIGNNEISCRQLDELTAKTGNGLSRPLSCNN